MKRIVRFVDKTLNYFKVEINLTGSIEDLNITDLSEISKKLKEIYPNSPKIMLVPRQGEINFGLGPIRFLDKDNKNGFELGKDFLVFGFSNYDVWQREIERILKTLRILNKIIKIPAISGINLIYVDLFSIQKEGFNFKKYFTVSIETPDNWDIKYNDITFGIKAFESMEDHQKIILRFKSLPERDEFYKFQIESIFINGNLDININSDELEMKLNNAHNMIVTYFIEFLTEDYKEELGLLDEEF